MNDDFLNGFREPPRAEFAKSLYEKLSRERQFAMFIPRHAKSMRVMARVLAAVVLAFGLTLLILPDVRVALAQFIQDIAGFTYKESEQVWVNPPSDGEIIEPGKISLSEAQALFPQLTFGVPSWSPAGFVLQEQVDYYGDFIVLNWASEKTGSYGISLLIGSVDGLSSDPIETGPGPQEVLIGNVPALLERGGYDSETGKWNSEEGIALRWKRDNTYYLLMSGGKDVNADELIRMAESIP
jgi:hypothetical protein